MAENTEQEKIQAKRIERIEHSECPGCGEPINWKDTEHLGSEIFETYYCEKCDVSWRAGYILARVYTDDER